MWFIVFIWFTHYTIISGEEGKLAGGTEVKLGEFPYTLQVTGSVSCGGTLVELNRFLTVAEHFAKSGFSADTVTVVSGSVNLAKGSDGRQDRNLKSYKVHPKFKEKNTKTYYYHNIAVGILDKPFTLSSTLKPVEFPAYSQKSYAQLWYDYVSSEKTCLIVGWGANSDESKSNVLKSFEVAPWTDSLCTTMSKPEDDMSGKGEACATALKARQFAVPSDAGSPLVCGGSVYGMVTYQFKIGHERTTAFLLFWPYLEEFGILKPGRGGNIRLCLSLLLLDILLTLFTMKLYN